MKNFQTVLLGVFGLFILGGVILFATFRGGGGGSEGPAVATIWGTLPKEVFVSVVSDYALDNPDMLSVTYEEIAEDSFDAELVEALAAGVGPDLVLLPQDLILRHRNKIQVIPFESYSERDFRDRFINGADIFLESDGIVGLPFSIDPLVLYYNRTLFANAGIPSVPRFWDELEALVPKLSRVDESLAIRQSTVPFGEFLNVTHAKEIVSTLIMQAGSPIVARNTTGKPSSVLADRFGKPIAPAESALRFYTEFANPSKALYSWNRALPASRSAFLNGTLVLYPGFASELRTLRAQNPNLNFDVAVLPQVRDGDERLTFGRMYGFAVMKNSPRIGGAFRAAGILSGTDIGTRWSAVSDLPPVRRDLLSQDPADVFGPIFYESAIIARAFLDPDPEGTEGIFAQMVSDITSGRSLVGQAVRNADGQLRELLE